MFTRETLLPLLETIAQACEDVSTEHNKTNRFSTAHQKMSNKHTHAQATKTLKTLTELWRKATPEHWDMKGWAFSLTTDGKTIRWSSKNGRSTSGLKINTSLPSLVYATSFFLILANAGETIVFKKDTEKLNALGIDKTPRPYQIKTPMQTYGGRPREDIHEAIGISPVDAYARLFIAGTFKNTMTFRPAKMPAIHEIFAIGESKADDQLRKEGRQWSSSLILWARMMEHPGFAALIKQNLQGMTSKKDITTSYRLFMMEDKLRDAEKALVACGDKEKIQSYFVTDSSKSGRLIKAWNENSAILAKFLWGLFTNDSPRDPAKYWKVYPLEKEMDHTILTTL